MLFSTPTSMRALVRGLARTLAAGALALRLCVSTAAAPPEPIGLLLWGIVAAEPGLLPVNFGIALPRGLGMDLGTAGTTTTSKLVVSEGSDTERPARSDSELLALDEASAFRRAEPTDARGERERPRCSGWALLLGRAPGTSSAEKPCGGRDLPQPEPCDC